MKSEFGNDSVLCPTAVKTCCFCSQTENKTYYAGVFTKINNNPPGRKTVLYSCKTLTDISCRLTSFLFVINSQISLLRSSELLYRNLIPSGLCISCIRIFHYSGRVFLFRCILQHPIQLLFSISFYILIRVPSSYLFGIGYVSITVSYLI